MIQLALEAFIASSEYPQTLERALQIDWSFYADLQVDGSYAVRMGGVMAKSEFFVKVADAEEMRAQLAPQLDPSATLRADVARAMLWRMLLDERSTPPIFAPSDPQRVWVWFPHPANGLCALVSAPMNWQFRQRPETLERVLNDLRTAVAAALPPKAPQGDDTWESDSDDGIGSFNIYSD